MCGPCSCIEIARFCLRVYSKTPYIITVESIGTEKTMWNPITLTMANVCSCMARSLWKSTDDTRTTEAISDKEIQMVTLILLLSFLCLVVKVSGCLTDRSRRRTISATK